MDTFIPILTPQYLEASRYSSSGEVENTVSALLIYAYQSTDTTQSMTIHVYPVFVESYRNYQAYTKVHGQGCSAYVFDLEITKGRDGQGLTAKFATRSDVILPSDMRGFGIGSYVFSKLIEWGQAHAPNAKVESLRLSGVDAATPSAREIRNQFYRNLGFKLDFKNDESERNGETEVIDLADLHQHIDAEKVKIENIAIAMAQERIKTNTAKQNHALIADKRKEDLSIKNKLRRQRNVLSISLVAALAVLFYCVIAVS